MWNEQRDDYPTHDVYRARKSITVFKNLGFKIIGESNKTVLLSFSNEERNIGDFMISGKDEAVLAQNIIDILKRIGLHIAYFDFMYDNTK